MKTQISGMALDRDQKGIVTSHSSSFCKGCEVEELYINIKEHKKAGDRSRYTVQVRAVLGGRGKKIMEKASESTEWEFSLAVRTAFKKLEKELKNKNRIQNFWKLIRR